MCVGVLPDRWLLTSSFPTTPVLLVRCFIFISIAKLFSYQETNGNGGETEMVPDKGSGLNPL